MLRQKSLMSVPKSKQLIEDNRFAAKMEEKTQFDFRLHRNFKVKHFKVNMHVAAIFRN